MKSNLKIEVVDSLAGQSYSLVKFFGDFDKAGYLELKEKLNSLVHDFELEDLVFDFHGLRFINSEGIGFLMEIHSHLSKKSKKLVLIGLNSNVEDIFSTVGIMTVIPTFEELSDYLNN